MYGALHIHSYGAQVNALVTGGAGFIGSALTRRLVDDGWTVRVLDNFLTGREDSVHPKADLIRGDLRHLEDVNRACENVDVVFHQGALRSVPRSVDDPITSLQCNIEGTANVLMAAVNQRVRRVVYASSSSAYGEVAPPHREDLTPAPASPYAASKLGGEYYCRVWTKLHGLSTVSLRYFNVYGPGQRPDSKYAAVFPGFISALSQGRAPEIHWDGEQSRDFTYIDDVVEANLAAAAASKRADGEIFNVGGGRPKTINEVLRSIADAMGSWIDPVYTDKRRGDIRRTSADITRAAEVLGWKPQAGWEESVAATVSWFKSSATPAG